MNANLENLASKLKIATTYSDGGLTKKNYTVDDKVIKFFIQALGYKAGNEKQIQDFIFHLCHLALQSLHSKCFIHIFSHMYNM